MAGRGRKTLSGVVADDLVRQIRSGEVGVGDRLPTLQELMIQHGVGYGVAREAMQQLTALGIVDVRPRRGAVVRQLDGARALDDRTLAMLLSEQAVHELYELRRLIEVATAGQAAERATREQIEAMRGAQRAFDTALRSSGVVYAADVELHSLIAVASGNIVYTRVLDSLRGVLAEVRAQAAAVPGASLTAREEHAAIVDAIAAGDAELARSTMAKHIETAIDTVLRARSRQIDGAKSSPEQSA